ncbi:MAG: hypothetical protein E4H01_04310 [Lysobacterales bacterium]|nr:MAG: hypothetical protein E4H01_04310 [Xanthomonadales bacterium]
MNTTRAEFMAGISRGWSEQMKGRREKNETRQCDDAAMKEKILSETGAIAWKTTLNRNSTVEVDQEHPRYRLLMR